MKRMVSLFKERAAAWREQIAYLFFGILTMILYNGVFWLLHRAWGDRLVLTANLIAFAAATAFAYLTNKIWVFESRDWRPAALAREAAAFTAARLFSFAFEEAGLYLAAYVLRLGRYALYGVDGVVAAKFALSIGATVVNYFFSKFWIFARKG